MSIPLLGNGAGHRGFSLIEVVLALGVVGFSLVAILGVFPTGLAANRSSVSDTRAAQIANAVTATIDAQGAAFSNVQCYGLTLDLAALTTGDADIRKLYVSYPSPTTPVVSATQTADSIYTVELRFNNDPPLNAAPTTLGAGKLNRIQLRIFGRSRTEGVVEMFFIARNKA